MDLWRTKLAAWIHDPGEKALVLFRTREGHEGGTVRVLRERLFPAGVPADLQERVKRADWWASAADRPEFPRLEAGGRWQEWSQVVFARHPELVHPMTGESCPVPEGFGELDPAAIQALSQDHFEKILAGVDPAQDPKAAFLRLWRLGPDLGATADPSNASRERMDRLWSLLPADSRSPDHSIWEHLRMVSAFAGAMSSESEPALLSFQIGPVQGFVAQARTGADLWAGSHLLSTMTWQALRVFCEKLGPDSVVFPNLHGVPVVDLWLHQEHGIAVPGDEPPTSDAHPLFVAALPNRFQVLVPEERAGELARQAEAAVREWVQGRAEEAWSLLLERASPGVDGAHGRHQAREQLASFPEVHWSSVPWSLIDRSADGKKVTGTDRLASELAGYYPVDQDTPGFLGTDLWRFRNQEHEPPPGFEFRYTPNPGALYPALHDLLDRQTAAGKSLRPFLHTRQRGYRCTLCAEHEWLAVREEDVEERRGERRAFAPWDRVHEVQPRWARPGEHLCARCLLKRLWPDLFARMVASDDGSAPPRFFLSTQTLALAPTLERLAGAARRVPDSVREGLSEVLGGGKSERVALPAKLAATLRRDEIPEDLSSQIRALPGCLEDLREAARSKDREEARRASIRLRTIERRLGELTGPGAHPETYYALLLMDGDRMGAWLRADGDQVRPPRHGDLFHERIRNRLENEIAEGSELRAYLDATRVPSPSYHASISQALNGFSVHVTRWIVERLFCGKVLYAGGDDLLAMLSVRDLPGAMLALRLAYSGISPGEDRDEFWELLRVDPRSDHRNAFFRMGSGFVEVPTRQGSRLFQTMGAHATASMGAVVAHAMDPLAGVLASLRQAEKAAKSAGRDAYSIRVRKRSGGDVELTAGWRLGPGCEAPEAGTGLAPFLGLRSLFPDRVSRRAAYSVPRWFEGLPTLAADDVEAASGSLPRADLRELLIHTLARELRQHRLAREGVVSPEPELGGLSRRLVDWALLERPGEPHHFLVDAISVAEFLSREGRGE